MIIMMMAKWSRRRIMTMMTTIVMISVTMIMMMMTTDLMQVGSGDDYVLEVGGFRRDLSTLWDAMGYHNWKKFSTK